MKRKSIYLSLFISFLVMMLASCEEEEDEVRYVCSGLGNCYQLESSSGYMTLMDCQANCSYTSGGGGNGGSGGSGGSASGSWEKHNGGGFIQISGSTAKFCQEASGKEWVGSYSASSSTIDINLDGTQAHFEVEVSGSSMVLIQRFSNGHATETKYYSSSTYPCSSSGGGGSGGGSTSGSAIFWTRTDLGCGNIQVSINGEGSATISSYYSSRPPCGSSGCANFSNLDYGTYFYSATANGCSWNGSFSVSDDCSTIQFTI